MDKGRQNMDLPCSFTAGCKPHNLRTVASIADKLDESPCRGGVPIRLHFAGGPIPFQVQYRGGCEATTFALTLRFIVPDATLVC